MKKLILPIVLVVVALSGCKKDYTCTCTTTGSSTPDVYTMPAATKSAAQANCVSTSQTYSGTTVSTDCTLTK